MIQKIVVLILLLYSISLGASAEDLEHLDAVADGVWEWRCAWQEKDIDRYMSFYSPAFKSGELDYKGWRRAKARLFRRPGSVSVDISRPCIRTEDQHAIVRFIQRYHSPSLSSVGEKTLAWKKETGTWQIVSEKWEPSSITAGPVRHSSLGGLEVIDIAALITGEEEDTEWILVKLNRISIPEIITIEGESPQIIMDFKDVSFWQGPPRIPSNRRVVKRIRAYLHHECKNLRIVLDLKSSPPYVVAPMYFKSENILCLEIRAGIA